jgi:hypothetical protein
LKGALVLKTLLHIILRERSSREQSLSDRETAQPTAASNQRTARIHIAFILLLLSSFAAAQTLTGTLKNSTTGKPSAGDEVIVFTLGQGMEESGRTKTDDAGQFSFKLDDPQTLHLVRAIHQGVTYHRVAMPGTKSVAIEVSDVTKKVDRIQVVADIMRIQTAQGHLLVTRDFGVRNTSNPPRTQMNEHNFEFYIPDGAHIVTDSATAASENGNPLKSAPVPEGEKNRYSFTFPLRPGFTHFEVVYQLPYSGRANINPKSIYPLQNFVVIMPKALQFHAAAGSPGFKLMNNPNQPDASVQVAANTKSGQNLSFTISSQGTPETGQKSATPGPNENDENSASITAPADSNNRPGGGLGRPIDAPDPLQKYRWWILGSCAALLILGGIYIARRQQTTNRAPRYPKVNSHLMPAIQTKEDSDVPGEVRSVESIRTSGTGLMEGIRDELFRIEMEHKKGQISQAEYQKAKAALDRTLERVLKRQVQEV